jgi:hypothetical protein
LDEARGVPLDENGEGFSHARLRERHQLVVAALRQRIGDGMDETRGGHRV